MSDTAGKVSIAVHHGIAEITFSHPKANCLSLLLLNELTRAFDQLANDGQVSVIQLVSAGNETFCAGASFEDFKQVNSVEDGEQFFMGFARVILAMRRCPKLIMVGVQGKVVGGGLGLVAAADYAFALPAASGRLSEFELGLGPFTIGPAVERKIGLAAFSTMSIDCQWRDAVWLATNGLYAELCSDRETLTTRLEEFGKKLTTASPEAAAELKLMFWHGTEAWPALLEQRAKVSGRLLAARKKSP